MMLGWLLVAGSYAQGVSKLFGLVGGNPQPNQQSNGFLFSTDSSGNNFQLQYSFPVTTFGANPANLELMPYNGKLYGTTSTGGLNNFGTIFEYDPATDIYTKKFDFGPTVSATGGSPKGSLLLYNNKFYGLAADYGAGGGGVIFEWDPVTNVYTKRYDLSGAGGANPQNSLKLMNGKMYGTTSGGGTNNLGVVFEWDPATNIYTKLLDLTGVGAGTNGWSFFNNVTPYNNKLYGATVRGGTNDYGTLLMIDPSLPVGANTTILKHFDAASGGNANNNEMIVYNNKLYGCLYTGGASAQGTLFELNPVGNIFTKLFDFSYTSFGANPQGKLVVNGAKFLGMCGVGGTNGTGTIYEWDPVNPTSVVKKYNFLPNNFDNSINPGSTLALLNSKFYAVTFNAGFVNQGNLFEYDYITNVVTKKKTFNAAENGRIPYGKPVLLNGKLYGICYQGPQEIFGTPYGCLWQFDPSTFVYSRKILFDYPGTAKGRAPVSAPIAYNGKLYGTTSNGGTSDIGVLYEYDPATESYTKKDMQPIAGSFPVGEPAVYNNKLYGMTNANGMGNNGIIYSYDPATGVLSKLYDVQNSGSLTPNGAFTLYNNKLYGTTSGGGANNQGGVLVYDPVTNTAVTAAAFSSASGNNVSNAPTVYNNKLYMMAYSGGAGGRGSILQFDPATNVLTNIYSFTTTAGGTGYDPTGGLTVNGSFLYAVLREGSNIKVIQLDPVTNTVTTRSTYTPANSFNLPSTHNGLTVVPAFIANGIANSCENYPTVVIDGSNNNKWVPILNNTGDVVAEIKANGNSLGNVTAATYINDGTIREDQVRRLYMDRNITITTQNPVSSGTVDIRLYIKTSELEALKSATNSLGQPSGISTISDIAIFKNEQSCGGTLTSNANKLTTGYEPYEYGYILTASVNAFSTFYFAKNTFSILPVRLLSFAGTKCGSDVCLMWTVENEQDFAHYVIEKSTNGINFNSINTVTARNRGGRDSYTTNDLTPASGDNYYRLKMVNIDGSFSYSQVIKINFNKTEQVVLQPNPVGEIVIVKGLKDFQQLRIVDMTGHVVLQKNIQQSIEQIDIRSLAKGIYLLQVSNGEELISVKLVKQ